MRLYRQCLSVVLLLQAGAGLAQTETALPPPGLSLQPPPTVMPAPLPADVTAPTPPVQAVDLAALRARFEDLKLRQAQDTALRLPASAQTLSEIESTVAAIAELEASQQMTSWRAQTFAVLAQSFQAAAPHALPAGIAPGTQADIALAVIDAQATLYAEPVTDAAMVVRSVPDRTTMLRIAESGPLTLVWSVGDGFAFVLSQFRQVF